MRAFSSDPDLQLVVTSSQRGWFQNSRWCVSSSKEFMGFVGIPCFRPIERTSPLGADEVGNLCYWAVKNARRSTDNKEHCRIKPTRLTFISKNSGSTNELVWEILLLGCCWSLNRVLYYCEDCNCVNLISRFSVRLLFFMSMCVLLFLKTKTNKKCNCTFKPVTCLRSLRLFRLFLHKCCLEFSTGWSVLSWFSINIVFTRSKLVVTKTDLQRRFSSFTL